MISYFKNLFSPEVLQHHPLDSYKLDSKTLNHKLPITIAKNSMLDIELYAILFWN